ncbi:TPA: hypothetical protein DD449_04320 [Candidatus Berkelbacteria bacterium]|uniref:Uncharacterized protein n=1 Tax=Berkelbacteria bacterium GW2011_GWE1_39_12 TaxID=1618337 RepID=A0A0G4B373_9BACT|nr:MAG: hypothetical protein UT28_C0001G0484 [Berkelbacteria bacterium GW2011_GWE1_39_12]HBO60880.1 hypothetical protein [Candidatus Berkelbacteria bacterium]
MSPEHGDGDRDFIAPQTGGEDTQPRRRFWDRFRRNIPEERDESENEEENQARELLPITERSEEESNEIDGREPTDWRDLQEMIQSYDAEGWRERGLLQIYGEGRLAGLNEFMDGERDFNVDSEDGRIRHDGFTKLKEFGRKTLGTLVNKKNLGGAVALAGVAVATGGVGAPAALALAGGAIGRGVVEAWHSINGEERQLREERAAFSFEQYNRLLEIANSINEAVDPQEKIYRQESLVRYYNLSNLELDRYTDRILEVKENWNRKRNAGQFIGAIAGGVAGVAGTWQNLAEKALTMDLDGNGVSHAVEKVNGVWHYLYNSQQEIAQAVQQGAHIAQSNAGYAAHAVSAGANVGMQVATEAAKNLAVEAGRVAAVFGGMIVGRFLDRNDVKKEQDKFDDQVDERGVLDPMAQPETPNPEQEQGGGHLFLELNENTAPTPPVNLNPPTVPQPESGGGGGRGSFIEMGEANEPQPGQLWKLDGTPGLLRIIDIDPAVGTARVELLNDNETPMTFGGQPVEQNIDPNDLLGHGHRYESPPVIVSPSHSEATAPLQHPEVETPEEAALAASTDVQFEQSGQGSEDDAPERILDPVGGTMKYNIVSADRMPDRLRELNIPSKFHIFGPINRTRDSKIQLKDMNDSNRVVTITRADWDELYPALGK